MKKLTRPALALLFAAMFVGSTAQALTYNVTLASLGAGSICIDLACSGGPTHTLTPTPQGSIDNGTVDVSGTSVTGLSVTLNGPITFQPVGPGSPIVYTTASFSTSHVTSGSCTTVATTTFCGITLAVGTGQGWLLTTLNLTGVLPEPGVATLLGLGVLGLAVVRRRS